MPRLPIVGGDSGNWGTILNDFLEVSLNQDGTIQPSALIQAGGVTSVNTVAPNNGNVTLTAANVGAYAKPSGGIPSTDLSSTVQADLTAASTAVQSVNGQTPTSGAVTLTAGDVDAVAASQVGAADGVASLGSGSLVPSAQLGTGSASSSTYLRGDGSWQSPSGAPVLSVFGRTGTVTAQSGDYTAAQVGALAATAAAGGDLSGSYPDPEVVSTHLATPLPLTQGGTGQTTQQAALNALAGGTLSGQYLRGNGSNVALSAIQVGDVPVLNQNTTGTAGRVSAQITTAATSTQAGQWLYLEQVTIGAQYAEFHQRLTVIGYESGDPEASAAVLRWRVKQQAAMGSAPYVEVYAPECAEFIPGNFCAVITTNTASQTVVQLWMQAPLNYEMYSAYIIAQSSAGTVSYAWQPGTSWSSSLPSGSKTYGSYLAFADANPWSSVLGAGGEAVMPRSSGVSDFPINSGELTFTMWQAQVSQVVNWVDVFNGGTTASGLTYAAIGLYSVPTVAVQNIDQTQPCELIGYLDSDLTMFQDVWGYNDRQLTQSCQIVAGYYYALGVLVVGDQPPTLAGGGNWGVSAPYLGSIYPDQSSLPASFTLADSNDPNGMFQGTVSAEDIL